MFPQEFDLVIQPERLDADCVLFIGNDFKLPFLFSNGFELSFDVFVFDHFVCVSCIAKSHEHHQVRLLLQGFEQVVSGYLSVVGDKADSNLPQLEIGFQELSLLLKHFLINWLNGFNGLVLNGFVKLNQNVFAGGDLQLRVN
jgi:hypothetical protein